MFHGTGGVERFYVVNEDLYEWVLRPISSQTDIASLSPTLHEHTSVNCFLRQNSFQRFS